MKRRGFFGAMLGIAAAPVAAKALDGLESIDLPVTPKVEPQPLPLAASFEDGSAMCYVSCTAPVDIGHWLNASGWSKI